MRWRVAIILLAFLAAGGPFGCAGMGPPVASASIGTVRVAAGLSRPVFVTSPPGDTQRLFIVEQRSENIGRIRVLKGGTLLPTPFLSVSPVTTGSEQGLLGLAFHPNYAENGRFYINYTTTGGGPAGQTVVAEYRATSADSDVADPATARIVLRINQPFANHNGGWIAFGPRDGYLYIASGDGGSGGDPGGNAQRLDTLLGKILRIDVDRDDFPADPDRNYGVPASNPFVGRTAAGEIWAWGLRNPWRCSFDRVTGDLYIADVGQNAWEELNYEPAGSAGGVNYGWRCREATHPFDSSPPCDDAGYLGGLTDPVFEYGHSGNEGNPFTCGSPPVLPMGCSITGGYVYRGTIPELRGRYLFADFCSSLIVSTRVVGGEATDCRDHTAEFAPAGGLSISSIASFGEDAAGELYICDLSGGEVFKIVGGNVADLDGDGDVDGSDFGAFAACFNGAGKLTAATCAASDLNGDTFVDGADYGIFAFCYNGSGNPPACS